MKLGQKLALMGASLVMGTIIVLFILVNDRLSTREWGRVAADLSVSTDNFELVLKNKEEQLVKQAWTFFQDPLRVSELENYQSPYNFYQIISPYLQDIGFFSAHNFAAVFHEINPEGADEPALHLAYPPQQKGDIPLYFNSIRRFLNDEKVLAKLPLEEGLFHADFLYGKSLVLGQRFFRIQGIPIQAGGKNAEVAGVLFLFQEISNEFAQVFTLKGNQHGKLTREREKDKPDVVFFAQDALVAASRDELTIFPALGHYFKEQRQKAEPNPIGQIKLDSERYLYRWQIWNKADGAGYMLLKSYDDALAPLRQLQYSMLLLGALVMVAGIAITLLLTRSLIRPIGQLVAATRAVETGNMDVYLPVSSKDEIGALTRSFNHMVAEVREKERVESMLAQKEIERHRSISEMVTGVAHELNTPLGIATYAADIILTHLEDETLTSIAKGEESQEMLDDVLAASKLIQSNIARASTLIQRFKTVSVEQLSDSLEEVDIGEKLEEIISLCRIGSTLVIELQVALSAKEGIWVGYPGYLFQVIQNLLSNIDRYAYPEGEAARATVQLCSLEVEHKVYFEVIVQDYGQGIPTQNLSRIFDAFYTTGRAKGGSGLGLAIVHNLVSSAMAGTIEVSSTVGSGTAFHITIPQTMECSTIARENT